MKFNTGHGTEVIAEKESRLRLSFLDGKSGKSLSLGQNPVVRALAKV